jgi:hypothetical protein
MLVCFPISYVVVETYRTIHISNMYVRISPLLREYEHTDRDQSIMNNIFI